MRDTIFLNKAQQDDNVYTEVKSVPLSEIAGMPTSNRLSQAIVSNGKLVNCCSPSYALLDNKDFFGRMEHELIDEGIDYTRRSFNEDDAKFYVDYILKDDSKTITINNANTGIDDTIVPMIRMTNSYNGSLKTAGYLGFFRKVCNNGMHMTHTQLEFKIKHTKGSMVGVFPRIDELVKRFLDNEMYSITDKINVMKARMIDEKQIYKWIEEISTQDKVFRFDKSDDNKAPSLNSELVHDIIIRDANATGVEPNAWLAYSAFNELIHGKLKKNFTDQKALDMKVFDRAYEMALS